MIIEKIKLQRLYIMTTFFEQSHCEQIFCRFTVHIAHTTGSEPKKPEKFNDSQYQ